MLIGHERYSFFIFIFSLFVYYLVVNKNWPDELVSQMVHKVIDLIPVVLHTARPRRTSLIYSLTTSLNLGEDAHMV